MRFVTIYRQAIAVLGSDQRLALFLGVVVLPAFTVSAAAPVKTRLAAFVVAGMAESLAFILLRYIPPPPGP